MHPNPKDGTHPSRLIIDRGDKERVTRALESGAVTFVVVEDSPDLDMTLLEVEDLPRGVDGVIEDLRVGFRADGSPMPLLAKDRDAVLGFPQHKAVIPPTPVRETVDIADTGVGLGVRVGVVDTAISPHPMLPPHRVLADGDLEPDDLSEPMAGHGTFVAGLIRQAAPGAVLHLRAGLQARREKSSTWEVAKAIASFQHVEIDILNLSLGCASDTGEAPTVLARALGRIPSGVLVIAAAGNRGQEKVPFGKIWPGASPEVVAVGDPNAAYSMHEDWVDYVVDGQEALSTHLLNGFAKWSGTSFSAAKLTGLVAARMDRDGVNAAKALDALVKDGTVTPFAGHA